MVSSNSKNKTAKDKKITPGKLSKMLKALYSNFAVVSSSNSNRYVKQQKSIISDQEKKRLIRAGVDVSSSRSTPITPESMINYANMVYTEKERLINENEQLFQMTPELSKASEILISSIVSPIDMQYSKLSVKCDFDNSVSDDVKNQIYKFLTDYIEEKLTLSTKFPVYLKNILYISGADAILTLPINTLSKMINSSVKTESFIEKVDRVSKISLIQNNNYNKQCSLEKFSNETYKGMSELLPDKKSRPEQNDLIKYLAEGFLSFENLSFTDNIGTVACSYMANENAKDRINSFSQQFIGIPKTNRDELRGEPLNIRLPIESLAPIFVPGSPEDHIGYLCLLDENGNPLAARNYDNQDYTDPTAMYNLNNNNIQYLSNAFGQNAFDSTNGIFSQKNMDSLSTIYQGILDAYLDDKTSQLGLSGVVIGNNNSLFKFIFLRYLRQQQTRILFIPKDYLTYMAFEYDSKNGTGLSIIEKHKYLLKLRTSILISRALTQINNSINRQKITISLTPEFHGDVDEMMQTAISSHILKNTFNFSASPNIIQSQLLYNAISVKIENGESEVPTYDVNVEPMDKSMTPIDEGLLDTVNDALYNTMVVPASAINKTSEDEFATGIVSTQIMYQNDVRLLQNTSTGFLSNLAKNNIKSSSYAIRELRKFLNSEKSANSKLDEIGDGTLEFNHDLEKSLSYLISTIQVTLPAPNTIPNSQQLERIEQVHESCENLVNFLLPDELGNGNDKISDILPIIKASAKSALLVKQSKALGLNLTDLPTLANLDIEELTKHQTRLINITKALNSNKTAIQGDGEDDMSGGGMDYSGGGFGGGDEGETGMSDEYDTGTEEPSGEEGEGESADEESGSTEENEGSSEKEGSGNEDNDLGF